MRDLQEIINGAAKGGWEWFDQVDPKVKELLTTAMGKADEDSKAIARAWADFAATPGGEKALKVLFAKTLERTVYFVQLGGDIQSMAVFGAFREGQNALAQEIARQIARGQGEDIPPRDVT